MQTYDKGMDDPSTKEMSRRKQRNDRIGAAGDQLEAHVESWKRAKDGDVRAVLASACMRELEKLIYGQA